MKIGIPTEIKSSEYRVGMTPAGVKELSLNGHEIAVQSNAGAAIGFSNEDYTAAGAIILETAEAV